MGLILKMSCGTLPWAFWVPNRQADLQYDGTGANLGGALGLGLVIGHRLGIGFWDIGLGQVSPFERFIKNCPLPPGLPAHR